MPEPRLKVLSLKAGYGKKEILQGVSLEVAEGEVVAVLGANGTGKTTFMNTISGFIAPSSGEVYLDGKRVTGWPPHRLFGSGIIQVSQTRDLFPDLTVADNLMLGGVMASGTEAEKEHQRNNVYAYFPQLRERAKQRVSTLSGGEKQMVAIGRALMGHPRLLLLDEPSSGLAPQFVQEIGNIIFKLREGGTTMLIVEQDIASALRVSDRVALMRNGVISATEVPEHFDASHQELVSRLYF